MEAKVTAMSDCCQDMTARLQQARNETAELIEKTSALQRDKEKLQVRRAVLQLFLDRYQLKPEEQEALSGGRPLDSTFFSAFDKVKTVHKECMRLLRTNQQRLGLDIMDEMTALQEEAYERLYKWTRGASKFSCACGHEVVSAPVNVNACSLCASNCCSDNPPRTP